VPAVRETLPALNRLVMVLRNGGNLPGGEIRGDTGTPIPTRCAADRTDPEPIPITSSALRYPWLPVRVVEHGVQSAVQAPAQDL
jgi:hypothetical protein